MDEAEGSCLRSESPPKREMAGEGLGVPRECRDCRPGGIDCRKQDIDGPADRPEQRFGDAADIGGPRVPEGRRDGAIR